MNYPFDPTRTDLERWFGPLSSCVMGVLWDAGTSLLTRDVVVRVQEEHTAGYHAISTTLERLRGQGLLTRFRSGGWRYKAVETRVGFEERQRRTILESLGEADNAALQRQLGEVSAQLSVMEEQIGALRLAWKHLCDCTDEFGADLGACAEWQDAVDGAILNVIGEA